MYRVGRYVTPAGKVYPAMALFSACFVLLFAVPCGLYFSGFLARAFTRGLAGAGPRRRLPLLLRSWDEVLGEAEKPGHEGFKSGADSDN